MVPLERVESDGVFVDDVEPGPALVTLDGTPPGERSSAELAAPGAVVIAGVAARSPDALVVEEPSDLVEPSVSLCDDLDSPSRKVVDVEAWPGGRFG